MPRKWAMIVSLRSLWKPVGFALILWYKYSVNYFPCYYHQSIKRRTFINLLISIYYWVYWVYLLSIDHLLLLLSSPLLASLNSFEMLPGSEYDMKTILGEINKYSQQMRLRVLWYTWLLNSTHRLWYIGCNNGCRDWRCSKKYGITKRHYYIVLDLFIPMK